LFKTSVLKNTGWLMMRMMFDEIHRVLKQALVNRGAPEPAADEVARVMTENSQDGIYTHGVNRFARLLRNIDEGVTLPQAEAERVSGLGGYEIWDGNLGFGIRNAHLCTNRAITLAKTHGVSCVSIRHTNHWLRGGTYGIMLAEAGMIGIAFTNTTLNMCAWGTMQRSTGNNPLVLAVPRKNGPHVIADTSFSEYSYGKLQTARLEKRMMPSPGGYDENGRLSCDPVVILKNGRIISMGKWKGSAIALLLDLITAVSSFGNTGAAVAKLTGDEHSHSQTFIAINPLALGREEEVSRIVDEAVEYLLNAAPVPGEVVRYPGQAMLQIRGENQKNGIPINELVWKEILELAGHPGSSR
jgi:3-dehydro-L-gulonate 2-dehydrogenase